MTSDAFYVYGVVKLEVNLDWQETGIKEKGVYLLNEGNFGALVHGCRDKAYTSEDPNLIKKMVIAHNKILDKAIKDFEGVIPLSFNTIIKRGRSSAQSNVKKWLNDDQEKLERIWNKVKGKKEFGLRIYYEKDKLVKETSGNKEVKKIEKDLKGKSQGLSYLLQEKVKTKTKEVFQNKINKLKQDFFEGIKKTTKEVIVNPSRISLDEKKDLLLSLSVLVKGKQIDQIKEFLKKKKENGFSFNLAGPFAPYSFVENGK